MFTGIVEHMGTVSSIVPLDTSASGGGGFSITVADAAPVLVDVNLGDSISVNGVCLTVTEFDDARTWFKIGVSPETLRKTNLGDLKNTDKVNLERAMNASTRFGGHMVQGHVDTTVTIHSITPDPPNSYIFTFKVDSPTDASSADLFSYIIPKGYTCLDGTSLTITKVDRVHRTFSIMLIAYTQEKVVMMSRKVGDRVNLEVDQLGKYVESVVESVLEREDQGQEGGVIGRLVRRIVDERLREAGVISASQ
ncbi:Riboflavin synthase alpha chain [Rhizophlyctis rosea]|uniref:Riboflavin synthase n=1 Tax=Rhizophlyctis rosea TaxID=64517 RepID=A0AAD5X1E9_9FUNG|nr:Riboflavin synthase alpha chain [Rhizophlyctis rosea]